MNKIVHQTKQAFLFSLTFYIISAVFFALKIGFAPILLSIAMLLSLIWVILVLLEIMRSTKISNTERMLLCIFVIILNIFAGIVYFYFLRKNVVENTEPKKK